MRFKTSVIRNSLIIPFSFLLFFYSCVNDQSGTDTPFDPNKPVVLESFAPDTGLVTTPVIIRGENFGNNINDVKVFFNDHPAFVATVKNNRIFAVTPKCTYEDSVYISVEIQGKRVAYTKHYNYITTSVVSTVVGGSKDATSSFEESTIAMAKFNKSIQGICIDKNDVLFIAGDSYIYMINEKTRSVKKLYDIDGGFLANVNAITTDSAKNKIITSMAWHPKHVVVFDPITDYQYISRDVTDNLSQIKITGGHHTGLAVSLKDGKIYSRAQGDNLLYRYDLVNYRAEVLEDRGRIPHTGETHGLAFHPLYPELLYIAFKDYHCIYSYNTDTREFALIAGKPGQAGDWVGDAKNSLFNTPKGIAFDKNGDLYIVDSHNNSIKKLDSSGDITRVAGNRNGAAGLEDGEASSALFDKPFGIAINSEGVIYITEEENRSVRRLAIE